MFKANDKVIFKGTPNDINLCGCIGVVSKVVDPLEIAIVKVDGKSYKVPFAAIEKVPEESGKVKGEIAQVVRLTLEDFRYYAERLTSLRYARELFKKGVTAEEEIDPEELDCVVDEFTNVADLVLTQLERMIFEAVDE